MNQDGAFRLMLSKGKAFYEMGYLYQKFEVVYQGMETLHVSYCQRQQSQDRYEEHGSLEKWLEEIQNDPDINKIEFIPPVQAVHQRVENSEGILRLGRRMDILNRLAHNLYNLRIGQKNDDLTRPPRLDEEHGMAYACIKLAKDYDKFSTLIYTKELNILRKYYKVELKLPEALAEHWPMGGTSFEQFSRVYEYYLINTLIRQSSAGR